MAQTVTHPITDLEGIGSSRAQRFAQRGVVCTEDLLALPAAAIIARLSGLPGMTADRLSNSFIPQARLLRLPGMDGQLAEGLTSSGYRRYRDLVMVSASVIVGQLEDKVASGLIPSAPTLETVRDWQINAGRRLGTGTIHLTVNDATTKQPIAAAARINGLGHSDDRTPVERESSAEGIIFFDYLAPRAHRIVITANGYQRAFATTALAQEHVALQVSLTPGHDDLLEIDEFSGGLVDSIGPLDRVVLDRVDAVSALPSVPPFFVVELASSTRTVQLVSLWRRRRGDEILVPVVRIPRGELPDKLADFDVLELAADGTWSVAAGLTIRGYRDQLQQARRATLPIIRR